MASWENDPVTDGQMRFIETLMAQRDYSSIKQQVDTLLNGPMSKGTASDLIGMLKRCGFKKAGNGTGLDISGLEGRYAVPGDDGKLRFIIVDAPGPDSPYHGNRYVKVQASEERYRIGQQYNGQTYTGKMVDTIRRIVDNPIEAMRRYGLELGVCGRCGRTLTDEVSRETGFGSTCRKILGIS